MQQETKEQVIEMICTHFSINRALMFKKSRKRERVDARFMYAYWLRTNTKLSLKKIGIEMSDVPKDHTSVIHAIDTMRDLISTYAEYAQLYNSLPVLLHICPKFTSLSFKNNLK